MFVVLRPQELAGKKDTPLLMCFIDLTEAYSSVDQTLPNHRNAWHAMNHV